MNLYLSFLAEETKSLGDVMAQAGLNTIMGISIVFISLLAISGIISLFGTIVSGGNKKKKEEPKVEAAPAAVEEDVEELSNDEELVAVITAAIYAYEAEQGVEIPADGLFVRSIRKAGRRRIA